eukprot:gb/GECG01001512.1/.p1 GENE.gb/GECG01001512.1/~~gb/GECG01001512.1/.p1  ORF type:complete len:181 (+),score=29.11 gb/GECG01001512.1/:1-543(+)
MAARMLANPPSSANRDIQALRSALGLTSTSYYPATTPENAESGTQETVSRMQSEAQQSGQPGLQARQWLVENDVVPRFQKALSEKSKFLRMYEAVKQASNEETTTRRGSGTVAREQPKKTPKRQAEGETSGKQPSTKIPRKNGDSNSIQSSESDVWEVERFVDYDPKKKTNSCEVEKLAS